MKKSLLLLSLLASANMFAQNVSKVETKEVEDVDHSQDAASMRPAGETHEEFLQACGGKVPHVAAHQTGKQKHLHVARGKTVTQPTRTSRRQARKAKKQARQNQEVIKKAAN